ncbi:MAG: serine hydrolase domain-containing protein [Gaiellaceae bacterium]
MRRTHQDDPDGPTPNAPLMGKPAAGRGIPRIGAPGRRVLGTIALAALVLVAAYIVSKPGSGAPSANGAAASSFAEIESFVQDEMAAQRIPGLALGIVEGDRTAYVRGFGRADDSGNEVTPQTPFIIGSVSKSFTALAVMQLVEAKRVELDAPVQRYVPWFRVADEKASAEITLRHLLNHTSGLSTKTGRSFQGDGDTSDTALEQAVRKLDSAELTEPVGSKHQYSTVNYSVLGLIVQTVAGQSYESYVQARIFDPLRMGNSYTSETTARPHGLATGHNYWFGRPREADLPYNRGLLPAGYLISSAADMTHYVISQLNFGRYDGTAVLSSAGIDELHRPAVPTPEADTSYGMGWFVGPRNDPGDPPSGRDVQLPLERRTDPPESKGSRRPDECRKLSRSLRQRSFRDDRRRRHEPARGARTSVSAVERPDLHRVRAPVCAARAASPRHSQVGRRAATGRHPTPPDRAMVARRAHPVRESLLGGVCPSARTEATGLAPLRPGVRIPRPRAPTDR